MWQTLEGWVVIVRIGLLRKKPDWTGEDFRRHWLHHHGALAARLPGLQRYEQNHVVGTRHSGIADEHGPELLDGFSMLWFDSEDAVRAAMATAAGQALIADEQHFIGDLRIVTVDPLEVIPPARDGLLLKRMSLLRRRADVTPEDFKQAWKGEHVQLLRRIEGVRGCRQNFIVGREVPKGRPVDYAGLPIDGIVELWFDAEASLDAAFASPKGAAVTKHAGELMAEITTFRVERHVIVG